MGRNRGLMGDIILGWGGCSKSSGEGERGSGIEGAGKEKRTMYVHASNPKILSKIRAVLLSRSKFYQRGRLCYSLSKKGGQMPKCAPPSPPTKETPKS